KLKIEDFKGAVADFTKAITSGQEKEYFYRNRGIAYYNLGNYYGAIEDYTKAISLINKESADEVGTDRYKFILTNAYLLRGASFVAINKAYQGCDDFTKAVELGER